MKRLPLLFFICCLACCKHDPSPSTPITTDNKGFPKDVAAIMLTKCATPGCHTHQSRLGSAGLSLTSWDNLFAGTNGGATVVPYRPNQSPMLGFVNTYPTYGLALSPTMPLNATKLNSDEVKILYNWIVQGAPNDQGVVKFADNAADRPKVYVSNQGCDLVTVFDRQTGLIMRYVDVGVSQAIESPHQIQRSPDGKYWYVVFYTTGLLQKFTTTNDVDVLVGQSAFSTGGTWSTFDISHDGNVAAIADWEGNGKLALINLNTMQPILVDNPPSPFIQGSQLLQYPHGIAFSPDDKSIYVTAQTGNFIYKVDISDLSFITVRELILEPGKPKNTASSLDPHFIQFSPDGSEYYITCQHSNEVRCYQAAKDSLIKVIPTGIYPQELAFSTTSNYLFVTCTEDTGTAIPQYTRGSVAVIDYKAHTLQSTIYGFFQPHGIAVSNKGGKVYVANRNVSPNGPAPHHSTLCGGRNGYIQAIDLNTLTLIPNYRPEVTVDPYSVFVKE